MGDHDLDKHLLDNFKYGGPGSHSNNNLTVSPKRLRKTQLKGVLSLQDKEVFSSQRVLPKFGGESKRADSPPYQEKNLRKYQSLHTIKKTMNEVYTNKQLIVPAEPAFRLKQKNPLLKSATHLKQTSEYSYFKRGPPGKSVTMENSYGVDRTTDVSTHKGSSMREFLKSAGPCRPQINNMV